MLFYSPHSPIKKIVIACLVVFGLVGSIYGFSKLYTNTVNKNYVLAPVDTDGDGLTDDIDKDDDNDGIPDLWEDECEVKGNFGPPPAPTTSSNVVDAIYSDYKGYWQSSTSSINPVSFDDHATLLAFKAMGKTYATGAGIANPRMKDTDTNGKFDMIDTDNDGTGDLPVEETTWVALKPVTRITNGIRLEGRAIDGDLNNAKGPLLTSGGIPFNPYLYEGERGLDMAYTIANIGNAWSFRLGGSVADAYDDGNMDILLTQGAMLLSGTNYNRLHLLDANGNYLGNGVEVNWNNIPVVGNSIVDQYNPNDTESQKNAQKGIRLAAVELSEFNLTEAEISQAVVFRLEISSGADPIFFAVNENSFVPGCISVDTDGDGIANSHDLDSDNDGIFDAVEAGHGIPINTSGRVAGTVGTDGIPDSVQMASQANSGNINYNIADSNTDNLPDYISLDSDADGCNDVVEAGFNDDDSDGLLGSAPLSVNASGVVLAQGGYSVPADLDTNGTFDYRTPGGQPNILVQPQNTTLFDGYPGTLSINAAHTTGYQWQLSTDGGITYANLTNDDTYANTNTNTLTIKEASFSMEGYIYKVVLKNTAYVCNPDNISTEAIIKVRVKNVITNRNKTYRVNKPD
ncbi:hypothetical protein [Galbibacter sp. PAP.153]|uniref:hypothetical protein n=1 Tax=Galbibacter sp. PAP.153 TaxID=3104623 RepID=UPI00300AFC4C